MDWVDSKTCKCCREEGTETHRLYHCKAWKEARNTMPDVARWCDMKSQIIQRRLEMAEGAGDKYQALEGKVDVRRFSGLGQKNRGLPWTHCYVWFTERSIRKRCGLCLGCGTTRLWQRTGTVCAIYGKMLAELEVQRTIGQSHWPLPWASLIDPSTARTDNMGLWRREEGCMGPMHTYADLRIQILGLLAE